MTYEDKEIEMKFVISLALSVLFFLGYDIAAFAAWLGFVVLFELGKEA